MKCYLASGWFDIKQENARQEILASCRLAKIEVYSPKEDLLYVPGVTRPQEVFDENIEQIRKTDFMIASTVGKDMGTLFECGCAFTINKPIVYYWPGGKGNFNLMLSQSAHVVTTTPQDLLFVLNLIQESGEVPRIPYKGDIE